jgi:hypothetical protein
MIQIEIKPPHFIEEVLKPTQNPKLATTIS